MKFTSRNICLLAITILSIISTLHSSKVKLGLQFKMKLQALISSDNILKRIRDIIKEISNQQLKSPNLNIKKKIAGALPDGYPKEMIENARRMHLDKRRWSPLMAFPTQVWRYCLFPMFKVNYKNWCITQFMTGTKDELNSCYYSFCNVCCDHLQLELINVADQNIIGELLDLKNQQGADKIKKIVTYNDINQCKRSCGEYYHVDLPVELPPPARDPNLGKTEKDAAYSCADIMRWGEEKPKSGQFWIKLEKGRQKVYCDMETDGGGWTLFLNYVHYPGAELLLNENKFPEGLKSNSHMYLKNAGFADKDVKEVRFLCSERLKSVNKYWHFKTTGEGLLQTALTGDQTNLRKTDLIGSYVEIPKPSFFRKKYTRSFEKAFVNKIDHIGRNKRGGFTHTPFGSKIYNSYWTIGGDTRNRFECGSNHEITGAFVAPENNPAMIFTHHTVWFRGNPPSPEAHRERFQKALSSGK